ncbi:GcrA family cell cycle regulator [Polymorphobacter sp. PAMC 29334]|uniref:GcrA family cell cycle regulator n=1 Tax=Polymorphobacter sp. PAMC 29334 TaxID=2862331 RepID=UPI001C758C59|nr:GcrA family cell cycle regulator [Polymorphobacter sp. PAMC 29334]QYE33863.1 GcrA family cell cycle regulator [Polymorphobacter sp. PAMC 29334]
MSWTDERIALLRTSWESGMTASQIAEALGEGVTRNAVIGKAHRLGLEARPSPVKAGEIVEDLVDGVVAAVEGVMSAAGDAIAAVVAPRAAPKRPARPVAPAKPAKTTLLDLSEKVCKWPIGHPGETDFHFCGKPSQASFPYCTEHCAIAYQAQLPRRDRSRPPPPVMPGMGPRR